ncbi:aldo/keto reductase [Paenibacillus sp. SER-28]
MKQRRLGIDGPLVSSMGLGCMGMSGGTYGSADRAESINTIHAALDAGVTLLDTGDFYSSGHNELLVAEALKGRKREDVILSVKFGMLISPDGSYSGIDCRPQAVKNSLSYTLARLNTDYVDIYRPARLDPTVPIEETIGAIADMVKAGYVRHIGLSEVDAEILRRAHAVHPITDLQFEYSLMSRDIEKEILPTARELGISITAYGILSHGLLSGTWDKDRRTDGFDFRKHLPRFTGENLDKNLELVEALRTIAEEKNTTIASLATSWVLSRGDDIIPLIGARRLTQLQDAVTALDLQLTASDLEKIQEAVPADAAAGTRY